jgi:hypothetical protein
MTYDQFSFHEAVEQFSLQFTTDALFSNLKPVAPSDEVNTLIQALGQLAFAINTEKARSEYLIAPVLGDLWLRHQLKICLLSGVDFTVDRDLGLTGTVDYLIGKGPQMSFITAPVLAVVEAKNESIPGDQGQCAAEMVAAQRFNRAKKTAIETIYGVVTNGSHWRFHRLQGNTLTVDFHEYTIASEIDKIMGILPYIVGV